MLTLILAVFFSLGTPKNDTPLKPSCYDFESETIEQYRIYFSLEDRTPFDGQICAFVSFKEKPKQMVIDDRCSKEDLGMYLHGNFYKFSEKAQSEYKPGNDLDFIQKHPQVEETKGIIYWREVH